MKIYAYTLVVVFAFAFAFVGVTQADLITITNSSFETPDVADGSRSTVAQLVPGWDNILGDDLFYAEDPSLSVTNITGGQFASVWMNPGGLTRTELRSSNTFTFAANTLYTLSVDITGNNNNRDIDAGFYFYNITSNETISTFTTNMQQFTPYTFQSGSLELSTIDSPELVGNDFTVTLFAQHNANHLRSVYWDNVQLDATVIPEPATLGLLLVGLLAVRMRRRITSQ